MNAKYNKLQHQETSLNRYLFVPLFLNVIQYFSAVPTRYIYIKKKKKRIAFRVTQVGVINYNVCSNIFSAHVNFKRNV